MKAIYVTQRLAPSEKIVLVDDDDVNEYLANLDYPNIIRISVFNPIVYGASAVREVVEGSESQAERLPTRFGDPHTDRAAIGLEGLSAPCDDFKESHLPTRMCAGHCGEPAMSWGEFCGGDGQSCWNYPG